MDSPPKKVLPVFVHIMKVSGVQNNIEPHLLLLY